MIIDYGLLFWATLYSCRYTENANKHIKSTKRKKEKIQLKYNLKTIYTHYLAKMRSE